MAQSSHSGSYDSVKPSERQVLGKERGKETEVVWGNVPLP